MKRQPREISTIAILAIVVLLLSLPILYFLSIGPAAWLVRHEYLNSTAYHFFYRPILALCDNCEPFRRLTNWYGRPFVDN